MAGAQTTWRIPTHGITRSGRTVGHVSASIGVERGGVVSGKVGNGRVTGTYVVHDLRLVSPAFVTLLELRS